jgi:hypothetical protein
MHFIDIYAERLIISYTRLGFTPSTFAAFTVVIAPAFKNLETVLSRAAPAR